MNSTYAFGTWLFLRVLAVVHLIAFISFWVQLPGLVGPHGLLPAGRLFAVVHAQLGAAGYAQLPSLCWIFGTGWFLHALCAAGAGLAVLLFAGVAPALCLALLWACYLSLACAGQIFFDFQWDALLLETTLLAIFMAPWKLLPGWRPADPPQLARWLSWWLLFRLMLLSGAVKLASGDPEWRHLTALFHHYETQPLPTPLAWYAHLMPGWFQRGSCLLMFAVELGAPFALFGPRAWRRGAAVALVGLQVLIALTGNYTFFNLLTIALCLLCLDDAWWRRLRVPIPEGTAAPPPSLLLRLFAAFVFACTTLEAAADFVPRIASSAAVDALVETIAPFRSLNNYGLFAVMTTSRPELIFEGSNDARDWRAYDFRHKPGDPARRPDFVAPNQPRLDWQLWFAALGPAEQNHWVLALCAHLLRGTPEVLALFGANPFPGAPPRYIRVIRYDYHFTDAAERARTGNWWKRDFLDFYIPPVSLN